MKKLFIFLFLASYFLVFTPKPTLAVCLPLSPGYCRTLADCDQLTQYCIDNCCTCAGGNYCQSNSDCGAGKVCYHECCRNAGEDVPPELPGTNWSGVAGLEQADNMIESTIRTPTMRVRIDPTEVDTKISLEYL